MATAEVMINASIALKTDDLYPPPYPQIEIAFQPTATQAPPINNQEVTLETSKCWKQARDRFEAYIRAEEKTVPDYRIKAFFTNTYTLQQTIASCEHAQERAISKYGNEGKHNSIRNLLETLNTFKQIFDGTFTSAPESISAVWCGVGMVIKIVVDDLETCELIASAYDQIVTIILACLLIEKRHENLNSRGENLAALGGEIINQISNLAYEILDFSWKAQHRINENWYKDADSSDEELSQPSSPRTLRGTAHKLASRSKEKVKGAAGATMAATKKMASSVKEAFTNELKSKHRDIITLYGDLTNSSSIAFQDEIMAVIRGQATVIASHDEVKGELRVLTETVNAMKESMDALAAGPKDLSASESETEASPKPEPNPREVFENYRLCFRTCSSAHEKRLKNLIQRKQDDGATTEKCWFLKSEEYRKWTAFSQESTKMLCLSGNPGLGKTMALLSVVEDLKSQSAATRESGFPSRILLRFFFKSGDAKLQASSSALAAILQQLLKLISTKSDTGEAANINGDGTSAQDERLKQVNKVLGDNGLDGNVKKNLQDDDITKRTKVAESEASETSVPEQSIPPADICKMLLGTINALGLQAYIVLDALDECEDPKALVGHLKSLESSGSENIKVLVSARQEKRIGAAFEEHNIRIKRPKELRPIGPFVEIVDIQAANTAAELHQFLQTKLQPLVERRTRGLPKTEVGQGQSADALKFSKEVEDLAIQVGKKVNGDFTYAGLVVNNLQQPSRKTLQQRIEALPSRIGEIYTQALNILTPEARTLVLFALRWIGWGVGNVSVLEIAEHFKESYRESGQSEGTLDNDTPEYDPRSDPEIREIISHLKTYGREFFRINEDTDPIEAHTSVREWIQKSSIPSIPLEETTSQLTRSTGGRLVFEVHVLRKYYQGSHRTLELLP
ncbi:hypothetical protein ABW19_dt0200751 [Dactylella cylindrospora]|nr:hypothetical protein ABW19_dt0200751 [Dactylella cylindrospora]